MASSASDVAAYGPAAEAIRHAGMVPDIRYARLQSGRAIFISAGASAWSEEPVGMSFTQWYEKNFGAAKDVWPRELSRADIDGLVMQNEEYVTAASNRAGVDPLRKPLSALEEETRRLIAYQQPTGSGVIKLSLRLVPWHSINGDRHLNVQGGKGWVVHPISGDFHAPRVRRSDQLRAICTSEAIYKMFDYASDAREVIKTTMDMLGRLMDGLDTHVKACHHTKEREPPKAAVSEGQIPAYLAAEHNH